jgi:hypothetical protein
MKEDGGAMGELFACLAGELDAGLPNKPLYLLLALGVVMVGLTRGRPGFALTNRSANVVADGKT